MNDKIELTLNTSISQKSIKKNSVFNFILTFANIVFPLVTMPYVSRILNISDIGVINHASALSMLFINIISLGVTGYGAREIARIRNDIEKRNKVFFSVLVLHVFACATGSLFYLGYIAFFVAETVLKQVYLVYYFLLFINPFMIEWFYTGLEEFKYIAIRSIFVKAIMFILLFAFVRNEADLLRYAVLLVAAQGMNGIYNIIHARKYISFKFFKIDLKTVLFGSKYFYFQTLVAICYQNINQLILGNYDTIQLALYVRATVLSGIIASFVNPIINALKPRLENIIKNDEASYKTYIKKCFNSVMFLLVPLCFGTAALSKAIMYVFGGEQFVAGATVLMAASFSALISNLSVFFNNIISTPAGFEKNTLFGNIFVAIFSLILNPILISKYGAFGAAGTMLIAESFGLLVQIVMIKKQRLFLDFISWKITRYFISALAMYFVVSALAGIIKSSFASIPVCVCAGAFVYVCVYIIFAILFRDENDFLLNFLKKLKGAKK